MTAAAPTHVIDYTVDGEKQTTTHRNLTPREILRNAGVNPDNHYLVQLEGQHQESYKDHPDDPIEMHEHQKFISVSSGPTPVS